MNAFTQYNEVNSIIFKGSNVRIKNEGFAKCRNLQSITFPNNIVDIGDSAFLEFYSLSSIKSQNTELLNAIVFIGNYSFAQTNLTSITFKSSNTIIGNYAFYNLHKFGIN